MSSRTDVGCRFDKSRNVLPGQFGNGLSSSPGNTPPPFNQGAFPNVTIGVDVRAQHRLVTEKFGHQGAPLVLGWSMGAEQTYEWAVRYPEMVKRAARIAGTAKTTSHDYTFVQSAPTLRSGTASTTTPARSSSGFGAAHVWAVMGLCPEFYKLEAWRKAGYTSLEDFRRRFWEAYFLPMDPNNLLCMAWKWRHGDVTKHTNGDLAAALGRIKAKTFVIPFEGDMFFSPGTARGKQLLIPNSEFRMVSNLWAHFAMFAIFEEDKKAIDAVLRELLAVPVEAAPEQARAEAGAPAGSKRWYRDRPALHGCRRLGTPSVAPSLPERGWRRAVLCRAGVVNG